eukprot:TRINITY_DN4448_c0_g1_i4.p2 TRINITY_DN4448_c0_g1~~TRINITY_DN4448_c0_g1_i4.p2  ORF type:complete len:104 (+),score=42.84 TRINITY_DN4448_c0_g1_i4:146-457(+)
MKGLEGLSIDEKYEIEEYRDMMKAFAAAATDGNLEQVKEGLSAGADINGLGEKWTGWTALHHAADAGHAEIVQYLLSVGQTRTGSPWTIPPTLLSTWLCPNST